VRYLEVLSARLAGLSNLVKTGRVAPCITLILARRRTTVVMRREEIRNKQEGARDQSTSTCFLVKNLRMSLWRF